MLIDPKLEEYAEKHTTKHSDLLYELYRQTNLKVLNPIMISSSIQGKFLEMISTMIRPKNILEVGTYTGYSAICLSVGLQKEGKLHTIDCNDEIKYFAQSYFERANLSDNIIQYTGNALDIIPSIDEEIDLVFLDADKENYVNYYNLALDKMRVGGFILADNTLYHGKVVEETKDFNAKGVKEFNEIVQNDDRVENVLLPFRDGITLIRKL